MTMCCYESEHITVTFPDRGRDKLSRNLKLQTHRDSSHRCHFAKEYIEEDVSVFNGY